LEWLHPRAPPLGGTSTPGRNIHPWEELHPWEEHPPLGGASTPGRNIHPWEEHPPLGGTSTPGRNIQLKELELHLLLTSAAQGMAPSWPVIFFPFFFLSFEGLFGGRIPPTKFLGPPRCPHPHSSYRKAVLLDSRSFPLHQTSSP